MSDLWASIAPSGLTLWLAGIIAVTVIGALTIGRLFRYGPARILFLAPAFFLFGVFVLYPIGGSAWMSLHDVRADRLICSDGREIVDLPDGETCRRVQKMEWVGLANYARFFDKTDRNIERATRELGKLTYPHSVAAGGRMGRRIRREGAYIAWVFFMLFILSMAAVTLGLSLTGQGFEDSFVLAVAALSTTGPLASFGAEYQIIYALLDDAAKAVLMGAMILGRLETLALIALLNPAFWRI